ncbi:MAG: 5-formyltetrahydrofolate cyclo-ligase [Bacteroidales bacterium]|nr:5-formyltetrahydrofolate cyclo-ligase [Bacteroidales bacterium]
MDIQEQKRNIRKRIKYLKSEISNDQKLLLSKLIFSKLELNNNFIESESILAYWSMDDEVYTHSFIKKWSSKKNIYLPTVKGNDLEFRLFTKIDDLKKGSKFGIYEPIGPKLTNYKQIDFAIIPGIAFDNQNNRLGRGKAFYDRILNNIDAIKVGICFDFQIINTVPIESTDIKMDIIISSTP